MTLVRSLPNQYHLRLEALESRELLAAGDFLRQITDPGIVSQAGGEFGFALSASGNLLAIGSPGDDSSGTFNRGRVHVYDRGSGSLVCSISNPSPATGDRFGEAVAISGTLLVVGARLDDAVALNSGVAYVFDAATGSLQTTIPNPTPAPFDYFGHAVAINGSTVFVGAYLDDTQGTDAGMVYAFDALTGALQYSLSRPSPVAFDYFGFDLAAAANRVAVAAHRADTGAVDAGAVYVFDTVSGQFSYEVANPTPADFDYFGYSVALSDTTLAVGAYRDDTGAANAGSAYTFDATNGALRHSIHNPAPAMADDFGFAVAVSGDSLIVGAYRDDAGATDAGSAYQFQLATGSLTRTIPNPTPAMTDYFGSAVAASGDWFAVGSYWDDTGALDAGSTYGYDALQGSSLFSLVNPSVSSYDYFGYAIAISGSWLAVGAHLDDATGTDSGTVYLYDAATGALQRTIDNPAPAAYDNFGYAISMSGNLLAVGAHRDDGGALDAGAVYVFDASTGALIQSLPNPNPGVLDYFGFSVSIAGDMVAVGASRDDFGATDTGAVYLFDVPTGSLLQTISNPSAAVSDQFGTSVALDGSRLVVGAPQDDELGTNTGAAYVYDATTGSLVHVLPNPLPVAGDFFGSAVAIGDQRVVIGAPQTGSSTGAGLVYAFDSGTGQLLHTILDPQPAPSNHFGSAVAISAQWIVAGAPGADTWGMDAGRAALFDLQSGSFQRELDTNPWQPGDLFGSSVAAGNEFLVVGAPQVDGTTADRGAVSIFESRTNAAPLANAGGPYLGFEGSPLTLDASASSDDRDLPSELIYEWDLNYDASSFQIDAAGVAPSVQFDNNFPVRQIALRVTDTEGLAAIAIADLQIDNVAPSLAITDGTVSVNEGDPAANSGSFFDPGTDLVVLSSSLGTVIDQGNGTWSWSLAAADGSTSVVITATDSDGAQQTEAFELVVANIAPTVTRLEPTITVPEGSSASNSGTYFDPGIDAVTLSSSLGMMTDHGDGTWSWSLAVADQSATVTVTATDTTGAQASVDFELIVVNTPPSVTVLEPTITVAEGTVATHSGTYADPGLDAVTLSSSIGAIVDHGDGTWSWSLGGLDGPDDTTTVDVTVVDAQGAQAMTSFQLIVTNAPPVLAVTASTVTTTEGSTATNSGTIFDPGGDPVLLTASLGTIVDHGDGTWSWSLETSDGPDDSTQVTIFAADSDGAQQSVSFQLEVQNTAPLLVVTDALVVVDEGQAASNTGTVMDPGADQVVLTSSHGTVTDNGNGSWSWTLTTLDGPDDSVTVVITATDEDGAVTTVSFNVDVVNVAPTLTASDSMVTVNEGDTASMIGTYLDPGADTLVLASSVGTIVDQGNGTWSWSLAAADVSTPVVITATDSDGAQGTVSFQLVVVNAAPTITRLEPTITVPEGSSASNSGTYFDPGIDAVTLSSSLGMMTDHGDGTWSWSLAVADQSATVTVTATDAAGAQASVDFELIVVNTPPSVTVLEPTITVAEGTVAIQSGTYADPGLDAVTLSSSIGAIVDHGDGTWSWSLGGLDGPDDTTTVDVTVVDAQGAQAMISFQLIVTNAPPTLTVNSMAITIQAGETALNGGTYLDPGGDAVILTSSIGTIVDHGDGTWSWSLATSDGPDDSTVVTITATDADGAQQTIVFELIDHDLATIAHIGVGDSTAQRSMVSRIEVQFDTEVDIDATAFLIERLGTGGGIVATSFTTTVIQGRTVAVITFAGSFCEPTGSLIDGRYRLTIDGSQIRRSGASSMLDADGDGVAGGVRLFGQDLADKFFRLFGDVDGDRDVDVLDRTAFFQTYGSTTGQPTYDFRFDADGDGDVDDADRLRFLQNYRMAAISDSRKSSAGAGTE